MCNEYGCKCESMTTRDRVMDITTWFLLVLIMGLAIYGAIYGFDKFRKSEPKQPKLPVARALYRV